MMPVDKVTQYKMCYMHMDGKSQREIGDELGATAATVGRHLRSEENQVVINEQAQRSLSLLPTISDTTEITIKTAKHLTEYLCSKEATNGTRLTDIKDIMAFLKLSLDRENEIRFSAGMGSNKQASPVIQQNIFNDNRKQVISNNVLSIMKGMVEEEDNGSEI